MIIKRSKKTYLIYFLSVFILGLISIYGLRVYNNNNDVHKLLKRNNASLNSIFCLPYNGSEDYSGFCKFTATPEQIEVLTNKIKFKKIQLSESPDKILSKNIDKAKSFEDASKEKMLARLTLHFKEDKICWDKLSNEGITNIDIYYQTTKTIGFRNKGDLEFSGYYYRMYILYSEQLKKGCIMYLYPGFIGNE